MTALDDHLGPDDRRNLIDWVKARAREGADQLHARAATTKAPQLTDTESAARARAKLDKETRP